MLWAPHIHAYTVPLWNKSPTHLGSCAVVTGNFFSVPSRLWAVVTLTSTCLFWAQFSCQSSSESCLSGLAKAPSPEAGLSIDCLVVPHTGTPLMLTSGLDNEFYSLDGDIFSRLDYQLCAWCLLVCPRHTAPRTAFS